jgi:hypothetical protein
MKLLDELLSDYPRVWEFYKHDTGEKSRTPKFAQRYPLPLGTISMILDFHNWTHKTAHLVSDELGVTLPNHVRKTEVGPCPVVMFRIQWLNNTWSHLEQKRKSLSKTLGDEVVHWHTRIRVKVNDGDTYTYESEMICHNCSNRSVMRINERYICVNTICRNPMTGEVLSWQRT